MDGWTPSVPVVLLDGRRQRDGAVRVQWDDPGLSQGLGVFETIAVIDGQAAMLHAHLDRLARGAVVLGIEVPDLHELGFQVLIALSSWGLPDGVLRIQLTADGHTVLAVSEPRMRRAQASAAAVCWPAPPFPPAHIKHTSRAGGLLACATHEVDEVLRVDAEGGVSEGTWSNVFCVRDGTVYTAPLDGSILPGITRSLVVDACGEAQVHLVETAPALGPGGWFLTSSLQGVVPVTQLNGEAMPVPPLVEQLREAVDRRLGRSQELAR